MTGLDLPIWAIAFRDEWLVIEIGPGLYACPTFGVVEDAKKYLEHHAEKNDNDVSLYRIVEYRFGGTVRGASGLIARYQFSQRS